MVLIGVMERHEMGSYIMVFLVILPMDVMLRGEIQEKQERTELLHDLQIVSKIEIMQISILSPTEKKYGI